MEKYIDWLEWLVPLVIAIIYFGFRFLKKKSQFDHVGALSLDFETGNDDDNNKAVELLKFNEEEIDNSILEEAIVLFDKAIAKETLKQ